ncbi:pentapeptide repeat-containing protein [Streptomyces achromogenes]|uniref:pentapeptide repeat-containing protein n=1 Tax=Streptomyces achromogenes TaxID=67255 RepID=UPI0036AA5B33
MASLWYSNTQVRQELGVTREGQITDRYTKAVENLGNDTMDVRLGGIYALQRIMQDSPPPPRDHPTIADVLATYIRIHASEPPKKGETAPADVQAALTVLAYRDTSRDGYFRLDLRGTHLAGITLVPRQSTSSGKLVGASLAGAELTGADLRHADLTGANLSTANLLGADLREATLDEADLHQANLPCADLTGAELLGTDLRGAGLTGINLKDANLDSADLRHTDLSEVVLNDTELGDAQLDDPYRDDPEPDVQDASRRYCAWQTARFITDELP